MSPQITSVREAVNDDLKHDGLTLGPLQEVKEEGDLYVKAPHVRFPLRFALWCENLFSMLFGESVIFREMFPLKSVV